MDFLTNYCANATPFFHKNKKAAAVCDCDHGSGKQ